MSIRHSVASFFRRNASTIPLVVIAICIFGMFLMLAGTNNKISEQVRQQNLVLNEIKSLAEQARNSDETRDEQIADLNRHLDCMAQFFSQSDRANKSIQDIQSCRITPSGSISVDEPVNQSTAAPNRSSVPVTPTQPTSPRVSTPPQTTPPASTPTPEPQPVQKGFLESALDFVIELPNNLIQGLL